MVDIERTIAVGLHALRVVLCFLMTGISTWLRRPQSQLLWELAVHLPIMFASSACFRYDKLGAPATLLQRERVCARARGCQLALSLAFVVHGTRIMMMTDAGNVRSIRHVGILTCSSLQFVLVMVLSSSFGKLKS
jgi:hypothetical protein